MKRVVIGSTMILLFLFLLADTAAVAVPTQVTVRVLSKGAKFVGTSMGGAFVVIKDMSTGEVLAKGRTEGSTGNTGSIMRTPRTAGEPYLSDGDSAKFNATIDVDSPVYVEISAYGPGAQKQSANKVSITQWILPGKDIVVGDAILLELPGFVVDILSPPSHVMFGGVPQSVKIRANVTMMCGCPIEPEGLWDANTYEIKAMLKRDGKDAGTIEMKYAGEKSQFEAGYQVTEPGTYEVTVYAFDPSNGNTGLDKTTFMVY
ncbi:hypothetical protein HZA56_11395 [Candidatus Poribacteria bacterium]|nr:hypothetical protein [Candidatus Poribacteria bacterium]